MTNVLVFLGLFLYGLTAAAQQLKGRVVDENTNEPLPYVSVFINTTTIGTQTNRQGEFTLNIPAGRNDLIVSLVGYQPIIYAVDTNKPLPVFIFKLAPSNQVLNEVVVTAKRDSSWYQNLAVFKQFFIGKSRVAQQCKLLNPEVLLITFQPETGVLEVTAREMLQIENPALGYRLKYLLISFKYDTRASFISYLGYPNYEAMTGNRWQQQRWAKNRRRAYQGSVMHFVRALRRRQLEQEGFHLRKLIRYPNPNRPPEAEIAAARTALQQRGSTEQLKPDDPIALTLSRANLPAFIEQLDTARVAYSTYLETTPEQEITMRFKDFFQVVYTGEKEELAYAQTAVRFQPRKPTYQTSVVYLNAAAITLEETGGIREPLDSTFEGYWAWEKVGDLLPLDYVLTAE